MTAATLATDIAVVLALFTMALTFVVLLAWLSDGARELFRGDDLTPLDDDR